MKSMKLFLVSVVLFIMYHSAYALKMNDEYYMRKALMMAKKNLQAPFGAVIVNNKTGEIIAEGVNASHINPTFHGEMVAINNCIKKHPHVKWSDVTLYTTAEPCAMCQSAIVWAGISRVVFATSMDYLLSHGWDQIKISSAEVNRQSPFYHGTSLGGVLAEKTNALFDKK
jgi:tRNA(adenine34) deaminase